MPTVNTLTPSFDASSATSSGSLSVSSPSVSSRMTCARGRAALRAEARQQIERGAHRASDRRAADRHVPRVEIAPEQLDRRVVDGRRIGQRLAREGDQPDAIAPEPVHELLELALGALEPRRIDVLGQHRAREVERDHQSRPGCLVSLRAPARPAAAPAPARAAPAPPTSTTARTTLRGDRRRRGHALRSSARRRAASSSRRRCANVTRVGEHRDREPRAATRAR